MGNLNQKNMPRAAAGGTKDNKKRGILHILAAAFCFAIMTVCIRLAGDVPTMQKAFFRNAVAAVFALSMLLRTEEKLEVRKGSWPSLALRCLFGTSGLIANFYATDHLNIADANMLNKLSPFFAIILSIWVLKEIPNRIEVICVIIAFLGALFIVKPGGGLTASMPALIGLYGGFGAGTAYSFVRKLGKQGERGPIIVLCFSVFSCIVTAPFLIFDYHPMSLYQTAVLLLCGLAAAGGQFNITAAYQYAPAKEISVFDYTQVIFAALLGVLLFGEIPDVFSILGYVIIIGVAIFKWWYNLHLEDV
ncbi:MAG: DMT family transporter [Lachnospiraceae bacterium]|nr:DMT family transporter [Lachnospiraceae bacterium]